MCNLPSDKDIRVKGARPLALRGCAMRRPVNKLRCKPHS